MTKEVNCVESDIKNSFEAIEKENAKFSEEIGFLWIETAYREITSLKEKIEKINKLPPDHQVCLNLKEKKEAVINYLTEIEKEKFKELNDSYLAENTIIINLLRMNFYGLKFSPDDNSIINFEIFDNILVSVCGRVYFIRNQQQELNEAIKALSSEIQSTENIKEKWPELSSKINNIHRKLAYNHENLNEYKTYSSIVKGLYDCIEASIPQSKELENKVEQGLKTLLEDKKWDNKASKNILGLFGARKHIGVPKNIEKMRGILKDDTLFIQSKIIEIKKIVITAQAEKSTFRHEDVKQLYKELNDMFNKPSFLRYDETNSSEIIQTIEAVAQRLELNHSESVNPEALPTSRVR